MKQPTLFYMNNCKIMQELYKQEIRGMEKRTVRVGKECVVSYALRQTVPFSYYEKIVCDAIYSIWSFCRYLKASEKKKFSKDQVIFTVTDVLGCMSGKADIRMRRDSSGESKREQRLLEILERLGQADVAIWWEEEMKERKITGVSPVIAGKFLPIQRIEGTKKFSMNLQVGLPVYEYASAIHQMIRLPEKILSCNGGIREDGSMIPALALQNSDEVIMLKHQILQRMEMLRNEKNGFNNQKIRYYYPSHRRGGNMDGLFPLLNVQKESFASESAWANKKQSLDRQVHAILDYYCEIGYLESYTDAGIKEGKKRRSGVLGVDLEGEIRDPQETVSEEQTE